LSLVFSVILLGLPGLLLGPGAAIMGFISRRRVAASLGTLGGGGVALAGLILGFIGFVASVAVLVLAFVVVGLFQCGPTGAQQPGLRCH
jgi:sugar phosphate permease